jgi:ubiquitin fusion degradation protein 1
MHKSLKLGKLLVIPYDSFSNYVNLPSTILDKISKLKNQHLPYHFEIKTSFDLVAYVGVKEFTAEEDCIEVPIWLAEFLADDYLMVTFLKDIPKGEYIKIQPQSNKFFDIPEAEQILESALSNYCLLSLNQIIEVKLLDEVHKIKIIECKNKVTDIDNCELIEITNVDIKVDIDNMFYEEQRKIKEQEKLKQEEKYKKFQEEDLKSQQQIFKNDSSNLFNEMISSIKIGSNELTPNPIDKISDKNVLNSEEVRLARLKYYDKKK